MATPDCFKLSASFRYILRENCSIIFFCLLTVYYSSYIHAGFLAHVFAVIMLFNQILHLFFVWKRPLEWIRRCVSIAIILYSISIVYLVHQQYAHDAEQIAETLLQAISEFKNVHSIYPATLNTISAETATIAMIHRIRYSRDDTDQAYLSYPATDKILTTQLYDFSKQQWITIAD